MKYIFLLLIFVSGTAFGGSLQTRCEKTTFKFGRYKKGFVQTYLTYEGPHATMEETYYLGRRLSGKCYSPLFTIVSSLGIESVVSRPGETHRTSIEFVSSKVKIYSNPGRVMFRDAISAKQRWKDRLGSSLMSQSCSQLVDDLNHKNIVYSKGGKAHWYRVSDCFFLAPAEVLLTWYWARISLSFEKPIRGMPVYRERVRWLQ